MKLSILIAALSLSLVSIAGLAADDNTVWVTPKPLSDQNSTSSQSTSSIHLSKSKYDSESSREDKTFTVVTEPIGISIGPGLGMNQALAVGVFLSKDSLLSIEGSHVSGSGTDMGFMVLGPSTSYNVDMTMFGVNYKRFLGNSFYVKGGVDYYTAIANTFYSPGLLSLAGETAGPGYVQGNAFAADLAVGSQWQWSTFTMGCEWGGFMVPFAATVNSDTISSTAPSSARDGQNGVKNDLFSSVMLEAVRFYIGVSF